MAATEVAMPAIKYIPPAWLRCDREVDLAEVRQFLVGREQTVEAAREQLEATSRRLTCRNVYVVFSFEALREEMACRGLVGGLLDVQLRVAISKRWRGPGDVILLDSRGIASGFTWLGRHAFADSIVEYYTPVVLHECAHLVHRPETTTAGISDGAYRLAAQEFSESTPARRYVPLGDVVAHDLRFIRTAISYARATVGVEPVEVVDCRVYGLSPTAAYVAAFEKPEALQRLWEQDLHRLSAASAAPVYMDCPVSGGKESRMASILEKLRKRQDVQKRTASDEYARIVRELAADKDLPLDRIELALTAAGKRADDLERDVSRLKTRKATLAQIAEIEKAEREVPELERAIAAAGAEYDAATARYHEAVRPRSARLDAIAQSALQKDRLRDSLEASADEALRSQLASLEAESRAMYGDGWVRIPGSPYGEKQRPHAEIADLASPANIERLRAAAAKVVACDTVSITGARTDADAVNREARNRLLEAEAAAVWLQEYRAKRADLEGRIAAIRRRMVSEV